MEAHRALAFAALVLGVLAAISCAGQEQPVRLWSATECESDAAGCYVPSATIDASRARLLEGDPHPSMLR